MVVERSFVTYSSGRAILPGVIKLDLPELEREIHMKPASLKGQKYTDSLKNSRALKPDGNTSPGLKMFF
ncbi:MAG: hypothetical protein PHU81_06290 [Acidobacteriota bacterium]|nr:hypothetical protein [Acidobacteriota bacterium]